MSLREIFDLIGLPATGWADPLLGDATAPLEARAAKWAERIRKIEAALIRRRFAIETLQRRHESRRLRYEEKYQLLLARHAKARAKLRSLQARIRAAKAAR